MFVGLLTGTAFVQFLLQGPVTSYTAERGELDGGRELLTKKKSASSGLRETRCRIRKHNCPTEKRKVSRQRHQGQSARETPQGFISY